jgi:hypothetical protein
MAGSSGEWGWRLAFLKKEINLGCDRDLECGSPLQGAIIVTASQSFLLRFSRRAGAVIVLIGCVVLIGWLFNIQNLKSFASDSVAMNPATAVVFILVGYGVIRAGNRGGKSPDKIMVLCAAIVLMGGAMKVLDCAFGLDFAFDRMLFRGEAMNTATSAEW